MKLILDGSTAKFYKGGQTMFCIGITDGRTVLKIYLPYLRFALLAALGLRRAANDHSFVVASALGVSSCGGAHQLLYLTKKDFAAKGIEMDGNIVERSYMGRRGVRCALAPENIIIGDALKDFPHAVVQGLLVDVRQVEKIKIDKTEKVS